MRPNYRSGEALYREWRETDYDEGLLAVWSLGQAGFVIKGAAQGGFIVFDPYLTYAIEQNSPGTAFVREFAPPVEPEDLQGAAAVLVSHFHDDHLDMSTLRPLAAVDGKVSLVVPATHVHLLAHLGLEQGRIRGARAGEPFEAGGFRVRPVAAAHTEYETDEHGNQVFLGYFIEQNGVRLYFSGDTLVTEQLLDEVKAFKPDVVLLPINGGDYFRTAKGIVGNMNAREAADFAVAVGADLVIPFHYDMFSCNRENPAHFVDYIFHTHAGQKFHMMNPGERFVYHR